MNYIVDVLAPTYLLVRSDKAGGGCVAADNESSAKTQICDIAGKPPMLKGDAYLSYSKCNDMTPVAKGNINFFGVGNSRELLKNDNLNTWYCDCGAQGCTSFSIKSTLVRNEP